LDDFLDATGPGPWQSFWGCRYHLTGGNRVVLRPNRQRPLPARPRILLVLDREVFKDLPQQHQQDYTAFARDGGHCPASSVGDLEEALRSNPPDIIYWLSHAVPSALNLGDRQISPRDLLRLFRDDDGRARFNGLAFLNACQSAETGEGESFLD